MQPHSPFIFLNSFCVFEGTLKNNFVICFFLFCHLFIFRYLFLYFVLCFHFLFSVFIFCSLFSFFVLCFHFLFSVFIFCSLFSFFVLCFHFLFSVFIFRYLLPYFVISFHFCCSFVTLATHKLRFDVLSRLPTQTIACHQKTPKSPSQKQKIKSFCFFFY